MAAEKAGNEVRMSDQLIQLTTLALPMIGNALLQQLLTLVTMLYVGHLNDAVYMGAATLGNML